MRRSLRHAVPTILLLPVLVLAPCSVISAGMAQVKPDGYALVEVFDPKSMIRNDLQTTVTGRIAVPEAVEPGAKSLPPKVMNLSGRSRLVYDEVYRGADAEKNLLITRIYRELSIQRRLGDTEQGAEVRPAVRRVVVLRSPEGKKNPFSPDGPLTLNEVEVIRKDLAGPLLVTGLLPSTPAKPGQKWPVGDQTVKELTDYETIEENKLMVMFDAIILLNGHNHAKLSLKGEVRGIGEDGPNAQTFEGTLYYDLESKHLASLSFTAINRIPTPDGKATAGEVKGTFVLNRSRVTLDDKLTTEQLPETALKLTDANSAILIDEAELGLTMQHSRRWRAARTTERSLTLEDRNGTAVVLVTRSEPLPTVAAQQESTLALIKKQNWKLITQGEVVKQNNNERFFMVVDEGKQQLRLDVALVPMAKGGWVITARYPESKRAEYATELSQLLSSLKSR